MVSAPSRGARGAKRKRSRDGRGGVPYGVGMYHHGWDLGFWGPIGNSDPGLQPNNKTSGFRFQCQMTVAKRGEAATTGAGIGVDGEDFFASNRHQILLQSARTFAIRVSTFQA